MNMKDTYSKLFFRRIMGSSPIESAFNSFFGGIGLRNSLKNYFLIWSVLLICYIIYLGGSNNG